MKTVFIIDPIPGINSVQYNLIKSVIGRFNEPVLISNYINHDVCEDLKCERYSIYNGIINNIFKTEAMHWVKSYFMEALFSYNSKRVLKILEGFDKYIIINLSSTVPVKSDIMIVQGMPFYETLLKLRKDNIILKMVPEIFYIIIKKFDKKVILRAIYSTKHLSANSKYLIDEYKKINININCEINTIKNFDNFYYKNERRKGYVLTYIGKETELDTLIEIAKAGVKIKAFGSKSPPGMKKNHIKRYIEFLGKVSNDELNDLYNNAIFTVFPFTEEPFGWVPIESMKCGTPVLTYNKQGPSQTVLNNITGWLVDSKEEIIKKAIELYRNGFKINPEACVKRAMEFNPESMYGKIMNIIGEDYLNA
ncbi:glycosyltransferase [Picrophilus oshimae]|uniref:Glycosyltransferase involved in cell wall bisynthesis n=1 Tax=Picrophilus torridus (strain ATCC 700027 / DSM 9790 / JCM 10055 / NBRC 100828 / KAW 2/3) TaxID=1122961 RepID=A0A8G2FWL5_PICTO|nr:glycosyltransferase [Picrophilus oshimae]SMD30804.1 Glycosyltransferase involved in cell wall bisynthesis [Picrophilus oshimae DSM 9789]